jgi:hypothetical protein
MRNVLFAAITFAITLIGPEAASARQLSCPGIVDGKTSLVDAERFYGARAVSIVRAGLNNDLATLSTLVSPEAKFQIWRGDFGTSSRRQTGVPAILEMIQDLKPTRFQISVRNTGPLVISEAGDCKQSATVLFHTERAGTGFTITFDFVDGLLVRAEGYELDLSEGDIR